MITAADYESSDAHLVTHLEVMIRWRDEEAPRVEDALTIARAGEFHRLTVLTVVRLGADASASCVASRA